MSNTTTPPRIRFNWGFHDGTADEAEGRRTPGGNHHDKVYFDGYRRGRRFQKEGRSTLLSDAAWAERQDEARERKLLRQTRPELFPKRI